MFLFIDLKFELRCVWWGTCITGSTYKKQFQKLQKEQRSGSSLQAIYFLRCYTFNSIHIASSAGSNKAITREKDCLWYVCLPLTLLDRGPQNHLRCDLFVTKAGTYYYYCKNFHLMCDRDPRSASEKYIDKLR